MIIKHDILAELDIHRNNKKNTKKYRKIQKKVLTSVSEYGIFTERSRERQDEKAEN